MKSTSNSLRRNQMYITNYLLNEKGNNMLKENCCQIKTAVTASESWKWHFKDLNYESDCQNNCNMSMNHLEEHETSETRG